MKNPTITFFPTADRIAISIADDEFNTIDCTMNAERLKHIILYPNNHIQGITWSDIPNHVERYPSYIPVCSQEFADVLSNHSNEIERLFKRCFQNILPELAGAEIRDVEIKVYYPTQDADAQ
jgi:hypothetical protein